MLREALFHLSQQPQLRQLATGSGMAQKTARRFVAGEALNEAIDVVRRLNAAGMTATLDHLGENVRSAEEAAAATEDYLRILQVIDDSDVDCTISIKLTNLGLDQGTELAFGHASQVVTKAADLDNFVRLDMESSDYVQRTLDIFYRLYAQHKNVGAVIQAELRRSADDLEGLVSAGARVRLVKGAYLEPPALAFEQKSEVDANFERLSAQLLCKGNYPAIATHDPNMIDAARRYARQHGVDRSRFEFQMLYGIRRDLQAKLVRDGYNVRIYVPFGTHWYPYLMRRLAERPANIMFLVGSLGKEAVSRGA
ncbi:MAG: proline dehydrogenase family protein [Chloroflexota bacterium]